METQQMLIMRRRKGLRKIGEAMLVGTPVIASRVGRIPSILKDGVEKKARRRAKILYDRSENLERLLSIYGAI